MQCAALGGDFLFPACFVKNALGVRVRVYGEGLKKRKVPYSAAIYLASTGFAHVFLACLLAGDIHTCKYVRTDSSSECEREKTACLSHLTRSLHREFSPQKLPGIGERAEGRES